MRIYCVKRLRPEVQWPQTRLQIMRTPIWMNVCVKTHTHTRAGVGLQTDKQTIIAAKEPQFKQWLLLLLIFVFS